MSESSQEKEVPESSQEKKWHENPIYQAVAGGLILLIVGFVFGNIWENQKNKIIKEIRDPLMTAIADNNYASLQLAVTLSKNNIEVPDDLWKMLTKTKNYNDMTISTIEGFDSTLNDAIGKGYNYVSYVNINDTSALTIFKKATLNLNSSDPTSSEYAKAVAFGNGIFISTDSINGFIINKSSGASGVFQSIMTGAKNNIRLLKVKEATLNFKMQSSKKDSVLMVTDEAFYMTNKAFDHIENYPQNGEVEF